MQLQYRPIWQIDSRRLNARGGKHNEEGRSFHFDFFSNKNFLIFLRKCFIPSTKYFAFVSGRKKIAFLSRKTNFFSLIQKLIFLIEKNSFVWHIKKSAENLITRARPPYQKILGKIGSQDERWGFPPTQSIREYSNKQLHLVIFLLNSKHATLASVQDCPSAFFCALCRRNLFDTHNKE